ncbi:P-loop containing nucleoside triphosphate hydrolase protein [Dacryopinax primogenitus]|uniref:Adenylate kinase isoenzyme 6 homolog n=1 Tax=Dacryopinax primogenitus (strain DJM 731) TaxID=1858805 RepID=M5FVR3_DACPD|nr:P-loop containing nucleoside triphosphate hydrolase protein [Dacryopinax primogenitus]EJU01926.1 P-loop containing nucleoside triphosphate hydrolase protein [Dacryopinax primogenitus]
MISGPIIVMTGTPGTGKTSTAQLLAASSASLDPPFSLRHINVGDLIKDKSLHDGWDEEWQSWNVNEDKLERIIEERPAGEGLILDWHTCDAYPERWADLVVVLRCDHTTLWERLEKRNYPLNKIQENNESEIMQVVLDEALLSYPAEIVVELKSDTPEDMENNVDRILQWAKVWREERAQEEER